MGGKSSPSAPQTPDPVDSIEAQARVNRTNTVTPFGSTTWVRNAYIPTQAYGGGGYLGGKSTGQQPQAPDSVNVPSGKGSTGSSIPIPRGDGTYSPGQELLGTSDNGFSIPYSPYNGFFPASGAEYTQVTQLSPELEPVFSDAVASAQGTPQVGFESRLLPSDQYDVATTSQGSVDRTGEAPGRVSFEEGGLDTRPFETAVYDRQMRLLEPRLSQSEDRLRQNLADRGLVEGSEAWTEAMQFERDQADRLRTDAATSATLAGYDLADRERAFDFGVFTDSRNFDQGAYQQDRFLGLQEDSLNQQAFESDRQLARTLNNDDFQRRLSLDEGDRNYYLNRLNAALQGDQVQFNQAASLLGLIPSSPISPIDVQGAINNSTSAANAAYQGEVAAYNAEQQATAQTLSTLATLAIAFSDPKMKKNAKQIGKTDQGHNLYEWEWRDGSGKSQGVMATEVPDRVLEHESGNKMVDYSGITW